VRPPFFYIFTTFSYPTNRTQTRAKTGVFRTYYHPFGSRFDATGGTFDLPNPPSHRNARRRVSSTPHHPFGSRFDAMGGAFDLTQPSLAPKRETGVSSPTTTLWLVFRRDGGVFDSPSHRNTRREVFPPFSSCFDATEGMPAGGYPLSSACFSHFDARRGSLLHLCSPSSIAYLGIMYII
jgi:hypothetical protein